MSARKTRNGGSCHGDAEVSSASGVFSRRTGAAGTPNQISSTTPAAQQLTGAGGRHVQLIGEIEAEKGQHHGAGAVDQGCRRQQPDLPGKTRKRSAVGSDDAAEHRHGAPLYGEPASRKKVEPRRRQAREERTDLEPGRKEEGERRNRSLTCPLRHHVPASCPVPL